MKIKVLLIILLALCQLVPSYGQNKEKSQKKIILTGNIRDKDNMPVEAAVIFIDSVFTKTVTDEQGDYRIKVDQSARNILAVKSDKGFGSAEIGEDRKINITLSQSPSKIPAVIAKGLKDNSASLAKKEKLNTYPNIYEMIRAELPGVTVSGSSITIKQGHSFFGSSTPLFVVNGVKVPSIDYIVPTQVKKIELLTGSSAAMYSGVDGAPGVSKITLKSGGDH